MSIVASVSGPIVIDTDASHHIRVIARPAGQVGASLGSVGLSAARVTRSVGTALGRTLAVDRDSALPDRLASLVERLQQGPLGQTKPQPRRVA